MSAESTRAPQSSLAPPTRRVRRTPIRVPIDDVPRGSLVDTEAHEDEYAVHVSMSPPADSDASESGPLGAAPVSNGFAADHGVDDRLRKFPSVRAMEASAAELADAALARPPSIRPPRPAMTGHDYVADIEDAEDAASSLGLEPGVHPAETVDAARSGTPARHGTPAIDPLAVAAALGDTYAVDDDTEEGEIEEMEASEDSDESMEADALDDGDGDGDGDLEEMDAADFVEESKSAASRASIPPAMPPAPSAVGKPPAAPVIPAGPPPAPPVSHKKWRNWFETFFNEDYLRTVLQPTGKSISRQCDFIEKTLGLTAGAHILDVGCGLGFHANELARRGYSVVAIDSSKTMVTRASEDAKDYGVDVRYLTGDMREMTFDISFDAVLCWGTTFGYFDDETNRRVLGRMRDALRDGGKLLLDVVNRDFVVRSQPNLVWFEGDGCICMEETQFNSSSSTLEVSRNVMLDEGRQREANYAVRLYALHELTRELEQSGLRVQQVSGAIATPGVFFGADAPRIILLAEVKGSHAGRTPPPGRISILPGMI